MVVFESHLRSLLKYHRHMRGQRMLVDKYQFQMQSFCSPFAWCRQWEISMIGLSQHSVEVSMQLKSFPSSRVWKVEVGEGRITSPNPAIVPIVSGHRGRQNKNYAQCQLPP